MSRQRKTNIHCDPAGARPTQPVRQRTPPQNDPYTIRHQEGPVKVRSVSARWASVLYFPWSVDQLASGIRGCYAKSALHGSRNRCAESVFMQHLLSSIWSASLRNVSNRRTEQYQRKEQ